MSWSRISSNLENLLVQVLVKSDTPMTLNEIIQKIQESTPSAFTGSNPKNSLYSIIYRREKRRIEKGHASLLTKTKRNGLIFYSLNNIDTSQKGDHID